MNAFSVEDTLLRRVARKITQVGYCTVEAPNEVLANAWAKVLRKSYDVDVVEGTVDYRPAWLIEVRACAAHHDSHVAS